MDSQDQRSAVSRVVSVLRKATRAAQVAPFAYLGIYSFCLLFGLFASESTVCLMDSLFYCAPLTTGGLLVASRIFKLCRWHRIASFIPLSSQVESCIDNWLFTFTQEEITVINLAIGLAAVLFLVLAYRHFFGRHDRLQARA